MIYISPDIQGWMSNAELEWLYRTAQNMETIVEIGSWKGRSTHALLSGCKGTVYAVDHFKGSNGEAVEHLEAQQHDIYDIFLGNVGHFKNLKTLKMSSEQAAKKFKDKSVDMVFIDGEHTYEGVKKDIGMWLPKAKKIISGHDYYWPKIFMAVDEKLGDVETADTIWFKEIKYAKRN